MARNAAMFNCWLFCFPSLPLLFVLYDVETGVLWHVDGALLPPRLSRCVLSLGYLPIRRPPTPHQQCCKAWPGSALRMPYAALTCPCSSQVPSPSLQALKPPVTSVSRRMGRPMQASQQNQKQPLKVCPAARCPRWRHSQTCSSLRPKALPSRSLPIPF